MNIQNNGINSKKVAFGAYSKAPDKNGQIMHHFNYLFDLDKYKCELELYSLNKDEQGNIIPGELIDALEMQDGRINVDLTKYNMAKEGFAYRYKLTEKKDKNNVSYAFDNGLVSGIFTNEKDDKYNIILNNRASINKNGAMQLIMPDIYYPGMEGVKGKPVLNQKARKEALESVRTHANKLGGNFYGIIARLPRLEQEGIKRIVGTPFTKDQVSSHKYWTENAYQISPDFGTEDDFKLFQIELFKHNMNWIADAALVNEGLQGIHLSELLRKGSDSYSKNMFRASDKISLGILPSESKFTRMKIINAPFTLKNGEYSESNPDYNPKKPTYIQFYDDRLADEEQKQSNSPKDLVTYKHKNTENITDITKHDDAVYPFALEVSPFELRKNVEEIAKNNNNSVNLSDIDTIKQIADFTNFNVVEKTNAGGLEVWDGNVDIAKSLFYVSKKDNERFVKLTPEQIEKVKKDLYKGTLAVRDYALNSGKYWTKLPSDTLMEYIADKLKVARKGSSDYYTAINDLVRNGDLPKYTLEIIDEEVIENIKNDEYHSLILDEADERAPINKTGDKNTYNLTDYILRHSMDMPLETLPASNNLLGVLTSPYMAKKANTEDELGVSRFDLYKAGNPNLPNEYKKVYEQVEAFYSGSVTPMIKNMVSNISGLEEDGEITPYGKYVLNEVTPELTKYIFIKALNPKADIKFTEEGPLRGHLDFSAVNEEDMTLQSIGIPYDGKTLEEESDIVLNTLKNGIANITEQDIHNIQKHLTDRFNGITVDDFKIAEAIVDRTESGLGWRIDASKDIAPIDFVKADYETIMNAWDQVLDFWKKYNQEVLKINPHAYTTAEITDLATLISRDKNAKYTSDGDAERKFLDETGITSIANYNYLFTLPPQLYSNYDPDNDKTSWMAEQSKNFELLNKLDCGWDGNPGFLFQSPADGVVNSYTFNDNHDKRRMMHHLALNMYVFNTVPLSDSEIERLQNEIKRLKEKKAKDVKKELSNKENGDLYNYETSLARDKDFKKIASKVLMTDTDKIKFDKVSGKSVAMGLRMDDAIDAVVKDENINKKLKTAVSHLAYGEFKGKKFNNEAFGTRPFEIAIKLVLDEAEQKGKIADRNSIEIQLLKNILEPAFDRMQTLTKLYTVLPGSPTDFAGDRTGASGDETKAKNYEQQNRNIIHWEYLENPEYSFVQDHYKTVNDISNLRNKKELSALNNGATVTLPMKNEFVQAILRYNDDSAVIALIDSSGSTSSNEEKMDRTKKYYGNPLKDSNGNTLTDKNNGQVLCDGAIDKIPLNIDGSGIKQGLKHGLSVGTKFKNARSSDKSVYVVKIDEKGKYYLERQGVDGKNKPCKLPITIDDADKNILILYKAN